MNMSFRLPPHAATCPALRRLSAPTAETFPRSVRKALAAHRLFRHRPSHAMRHGQKPNIAEESVMMTTCAEGTRKSLRSASVTGRIWTI